MNEKNNLSLIQNKKLEELIIDLYSSDLQKSFNKNYDTFLSKKGYKFFPINRKKYDFDKNFIKKLKIIKFTNQILMIVFSRDMTKDQLKNEIFHIYFMVNPIKNHEIF